MDYHAPTKKFVLNIRDIESATYSFIYALRNIRQSNGLPLTKYERDVVLTEADHAQKGIIDGAKYIGIDLGANWGNELDLTEFP